MKKKSLKVTINEPCHESWSNMTPTQQGRFCDSCAKPVIDFSRSTDIEIIQFLEEHKGQKTCGRFHVSQLDRPIHQAPIQHKTSSFSLRAALMGATLSSLLGLESCKSDEPVIMGDVAAINTTEQPVACTKTDLTEIKQGEVSIQTYDHHNEKLMSGYITDAEGNKIQNAKLTLFNEENKEIGKAFSKTDGSFRLELNWDKKPSYVQITSDDYAMFVITLGTTESLQEMKIVLNEMMMMKGDIDVQEH